MPALPFPVPKTGCCLILSYWMTVQGWRVAVEFFAVALLCRLVEQTRNLRDERRARFFIGNTACQNHKDKRPRRINNRSVVINLGNVARFVRYGSAAGETRRNPVVELLTLEDVHHLARGIGIHGTVFCDGFHEHLKTARRRRIVQTFFESFVVFHTSQHIHAIGVEPRDLSPNIFHAELFDDQIRRQIAAGGDHQIA